MKTRLFGSAARSPGNLSANSKSFRVELPWLLSDLQTEKWGPTHDPIAILAVDASSTPRSVYIVICPVDGTAVRWESGKSSRCTTCNGRYCIQPKFTPDHDPGGRPGILKDRWINGVENACGDCGWPDPN